MKPPRTLQEAIIYFSDPDRAFEYAVKLRWADGKVICPRCSSESNYFIKTRKLWLCRGCNRQFTLKVNTIFEDSALGMDKWMAAFWMLVNCKNGISSMEIHRALGITQKTAWFVLQRLRLALRAGSFGAQKKMGGPDTELEADETFVGGLTKNMHKGRKLRLVRQGGMHGGKTVIQGILDRDLRQVRAQIVPNVTRGFGRERGIHGERRLVGGNGDALRTGAGHAVSGQVSRAGHLRMAGVGTAQLASEVLSEVAGALEYVERVRTGHGPAKIARLR